MASTVACRADSTSLASFSEVFRAAMIAFAAS